MAKKDLHTSLWMLDLIEKASRSDRFCASGDLPPVDPGLKVAGVGQVKFPLKPKQVKQLIEVGRVAPFGKGSQTLVDTKVRNTIEWDASQVQLSKSWNSMISDLVGNVAAALGLQAAELEASLYKMLLYERGGHFQWHRDSEKKNSMVASLIVMLPNDFDGGALVVRHGDQRQSFGFEAARRCLSPSYVAFYADCEHEVKRVDRGRRVCLAYNLTLKKSREKVQPAKPSFEVDALARSIEQYVANQAMNPLVFALEHLYTQKGLKQTLLKGADRQLADLVSAAAEQAGCRAYLAQIKWHVVKAAYDGSWGYSRRGYSEQSRGDIEVGETIDEDLQGSEWRELSGKSQPFGAISLSADSIVSKSPVDDWKPTSEEYEGYTGNAGNTLDRWYHRSALILWRDDQHFDILANSDQCASVELFESMQQKLAKLPKSRFEAAAEDCKRLASAILRQWPERSLWGYRYDLAEDADRSRENFISAVCQFADAALIREVLTVMIKRDKVTRLDKFLSTAAKKIGLQPLAHELAELFSPPGDRHDRLFAPREFSWFSTLAQAVQQGPERDLLAGLAPLAARRFVESYAGDEWPYGVDIHPAGQSLEDLLQALIVLERSDEIAVVVEAVETRAERFRIHAEQTDCLLKLVGWCMRKKLDIPAAILEWLKRVEADLHRRTRKRPAAPADETRPAAMKCPCKYCAAVNQFLSNSILKTTHIAAAQTMRNHIQSEIRRCQADLVTKLEKVGSPHRLVLQKTTGSFERALKQLDVDSSALKKLKACRSEL